MARLCPSDAITLSLAHSAELETLSLLRKELPNDYVVFHGVHWSNASRHRTVFGEIDFVIVNRSGAIVVIEQKNGPLEEDETGLVKHYGDNSKHVTSQIQRSIAAIRDKFSAQHGRNPGLEIDYLIYCPDYRVVNVSAAGIDSSRTVDAAAKRSLAARIQSLLGPGRDAPRARQLEAFFRQTFGIVPDVSAHIASHEHVYTQMVDGLAEVVEKLEIEPFRLRVVGTAGSGKSLLAAQFVGRALERGMRPLVLCYNRPLADGFESVLPKGASVFTYLGFCTEAARKAGADFDFDRDGRDTGVWQSLQEQLVAAESTGPKFDCLVVDEGQDFEPEWFEILQLFLTDDAAILWLEDPLQNLSGRAPVSLPGFVTYRETANFRSPRSLGRFIERALGVELELRNPLPGLGVAVHAYEEPEEQVKLVSHRIAELVKLGFRHEDIAVVSCRGLEHALFASRDRLGPLPVRRFRGSYDAAGRQMYTEGKILCDTIFRFKGQQAPAVILTDVDASLTHCDRTRAILYCGMTRATVRLEVVAQSASPMLPALLAAAREDRAERRPAVRAVADARAAEGARRRGPSSP